MCHCIYSAIQLSSCKCVFNKLSCQLSVVRERHLISLISLADVSFNDPKHLIVIVCDLEQRWLRRCIRSTKLLYAGPGNYASRYVTQVNSAWPSLRDWVGTVSTSGGWGVNRLTARCTSPVYPWSRSLSVSSGGFRGVGRSEPAPLPPTPFERRTDAVTVLLISDNGTVL